MISTIDESRNSVRTKIKRIMVLVLMSIIVFSLTGCNEEIDVPEGQVAIAFDTDVYGIELSPIVGIPGKNIEAPDDPVRPGYTFLGWKDIDGKYVRLTIFPKESITLYADWSKNGEIRTFKIEFLTNSSQHIDAIYLDTGDAIPELPVLDYYETDTMKYAFKKWTYQDSKFDLEVMPGNDIVLVAEWDSGPYAIYFDTPNGQDITPVVGNAGDDVSAPEVGVVMEDFVFKGWEYQGTPYVFGTMPNKDITLSPDWLDTSSSVYNENSSLPKLFVNLSNNVDLVSVNRETYIDSTITISNDDGEYQLFSQSAEFRGRGNGSWIDSGPKRGYRIKFSDKQDLFGEQKSKHWVLLAGANFYDTTLLKTKLAFDMANELFTNIEYASSTNWVELYVNGEYRGVYILAEHTRVQKERIDIDSQFNVEDTGYLIEYDSYAFQDTLGVDYFMVEGYRYGFSIKSPDSDDYLEEGMTQAQFEQQVKFIEEYTAETLIAALNSPNDAVSYELFKANADVASFVDMYILHELFKNTDTGWSSFYMYKKAGGKLYAGAPWDFDASAGTNRGNQTPTGLYVAGSAAYESDFTSSELFLALMQVDEFQSEVSLRYQELYFRLKTFVSGRTDDTFITENTDAFGKNFYFWSENSNIEGLSGAYSNYSSLESAKTGWANEVNKLETWLLTRIEWLEEEWS